MLRGGFAHVAVVDSKTATIRVDKTHKIPNSRRFEHSTGHRPSNHRGARRIPFFTHFPVSPRAATESETQILFFPKEVLLFLSLCRAKTLLRLGDGLLVLAEHVGQRSTVEKKLGTGVPRS